MHNYTHIFEKSLEQLTGKPCWGFLAGPPLGSIIHILLGDKQKRKKPINNPQLPIVQRHYGAEYMLMIQCCWRLDSESEIITGSHDSNVECGPMLKGLEQLRGAIITEINFSKPAYDLVISFNNGLRLNVLCIYIDKTLNFENYTYFTPIGSYTIDMAGKISFEK